METPFEFGDLAPEFMVSDYETSLGFYRDIIGFEVAYTRTSPQFAYLCLNQAQIMIQQIEPTDVHTGELEYPFGRGVNFEIGISDVDALAVRLKDAGYELMLEPTDFWRETGVKKSGSRELRVLDPDGYYLRFSKSIEK